MAGPGLKELLLGTNPIMPWSGRTVVGTVGMAPLGDCGDFDSGEDSMFSWLASILSRSAGSIGFLPDPVLELVLCTRYAGLVAAPFGDGLGGVTNPFDVSRVSWSPALWPGAFSEVPQRHFCFLGKAAVTAAQPQGCDEGCGHELSGRPGLRTGTISRSLAWVHLVERWPRMHGSLHHDGQSQRSEEKGRRCKNSVEQGCEQKGRSKGTYQAIFWPFMRGMARCRRDSAFRIVGFQISCAREPMPSAATTAYDAPQSN